jgi:hypothetical protein
MAALEYDIVNPFYELIIYLCNEVLFIKESSLLPGYYGGMKYFVKIPFSGDNLLI